MAKETWSMRAMAAVTPGNTYIEVASCYARANLDDPGSFQFVLDVTKGYVLSKVRRGKGAEMAGPGGKLERLEVKYAFIGFQDIFYLTRCELGLPFSSLKLPPPTAPARARLERAGWILDPGMFYNPSEYRRGRTDIVKDIARSNSRDARCSRETTGSRGHSVDMTPSSSTIPIPATPLMTPSRPSMHSSASSMRSTHGRSLRTYQDDPMNSPPRPESALRGSFLTDSPSDETPGLDDPSHDDLPSDFFSSDRPIRQSPFISACSSPAIAVADHDIPDLAFDMDLDSLQDPFAPPPRHLPRVPSGSTPLSPLLRATPTRTSSATPVQMQEAGGQRAASAASASDASDTSRQLFAPDTVTREDLRQFEQRQTELLRTLMLSKRAREGLAPPPYRPTRPDWVPEWV